MAPAQKLCEALDQKAYPTLSLQARLEPTENPQPEGSPALPDMGDYAVPTFCGRARGGTVRRPSEHRNGVSGVGALAPTDTVHRLPADLPGVHQPEHVGFRHALSGFGHRKLDETIRQVDRELVAIARDFQFLLLVTPTNTDAAFREFREGGTEPCRRSVTG